MPALELLRKNTELVVCDFVECARWLAARTGFEGNPDAKREDGVPFSDTLRDALEVAVRVRHSGGMTRARVFLLRACWRVHVPWLPEELCPTAMPPDCRMHYGSRAKQMLLDGLIMRGQHDVASAITQQTGRAGSVGSDSFVPSNMSAWFALHGF